MVRWKLLPSAWVAQELSHREAEIKQREKQLEERQQELQNLQRTTVTGTPAPIKNWPPCSPILYHDIEAEIPVGLQRTVKRAYQAYLASHTFGVSCLRFFL